MKSKQTPARSSSKAVAKTSKKAAVRKTQSRTKPKTIQTSNKYKKKSNKKSLRRAALSATTSSKKRKTRSQSAERSPRSPQPRISKRALSTPVLVMAGEHSGDLLGSEITAALKRYGFESFFGTGGDAMKSEGVELIEHIRDMNVMGFVEALRAWRRLKRLARSVAEEAQRRGVHIAILIDYPGFNLRLAAMLKEKGIKVIFVVSPQLWAWHYSRINEIRRVVDLMLPLFPFEEEIYTKEGIPATSIGHPLVHRLPRELRREPPLPLPSRRPKRTIALIPGSRFGEVSRLLPDMLGAARLLKENEAKTRFLLACADESLQGYIEQELAAYPELGVETYLGRTYRIMEESDALIIASGTATLEGAYFRKPMVLLYRVSPLNLFIGSLLIRIRYVGIVNILGRKPTILELLQSEVTPTNIAAEIERILTDSEYRKNMTMELNYVRRQLGSKNPARKAAEAILAFLTGRTGRRP